MSEDDMNTHALLLSDPVNFAAVQLPDRKFPGVVCQGDALNSLVQALDSMMQALKDRDLDEMEKPNQPLEGRAFCGPDPL
ncbi:DUF6959 family protein [Chitinimonas prasina]|uniref:DUF6959 family protein n=1 Tax=Chitinimonas prasina TaxID=1434937 RepID=UPI0024E0D657|nr:hypothetical protein [Chitinimonas prasina]